MLAVAVHRLVFEVHRAAEETFFCNLHYIVATSFESSHGFLYDLGTTHEAISGGKIPALLVLSIFISISEARDANAKLEKFIFGILKQRMRLLVARAFCFSLWCVCS